MATTAGLRNGYGVQDSDKVNVDCRYEENYNVTMQRGSRRKALGKACGELEEVK